MAMVPWRTDPRVIDPVRLAEIELFADVMIAASAAPTRVPQDSLDRLLGIRRRPARAPFRLPTPVCGERPDHRPKRVGSDKPRRSRAP